MLMVRSWMISPAFVLPSGITQPCPACDLCAPECAQVFTTAATDESPQIVRLAFDTIEKIVREHFHYITGEHKATRAR